MSSSGHSVSSESANSPTVASSRPLRCCASSPMIPMNRSRAAWSISGNDAIVSIAARMLASDARVPCVSVCSRRPRRLPASIRRVMLSSTSTNPEIPSAAAASVASGGAPSTGAICTRTSWPPGAVVTKFATGPRAPWRSRSWMLSSAWMIRLRSKMAKIERPSPTRLCAFPAAAALASGFRSSCIARALYSSMRPSTLHMTTLWASSDISAARRLRSCSMRALASRTRWSKSRCSDSLVSANAFTLSASRRISAAPRSGARCEGFAASMILASSLSCAGAVT